MAKTMRMRGRVRGLGVTSVEQRQKMDVRWRLATMENPCSWQTQRSLCLPLQPLNVSRLRKHQTPGEGDIESPAWTTLADAFESELQYAHTELALMTVVIDSSA